MLDELLVKAKEDGTGSAGSGNSFYFRLLGPEATARSREE